MWKLQYEALQPFSAVPAYNPITLLNMTGIRLSDTPDLSAKVAVVTGGQAGIGREITA